MPPYNYERLSAQDHSFLVAETPTTHMHVAGVLVYERGELGTQAGGVDFAAIRRATEAALHRIPRYRQKLRWIPGVNRPVWVDDPNFNLDYHLRHTSLPRPGRDRQLQRLAARVMAQPLDRERPLWEMWVVEGLEGDRFAVVSKVHHCMIDGVSGVDLARILLSPKPERDAPEPERYVPRKLPTSGGLLFDELRRRAALPFRALGGLRDLRRRNADLREELALRGRALRELLTWLLMPASETPLNGPTGPHRRFDWLSMPLAEVKEVRKALGASVNDVLLAVVAGAIRAYLQHRRVNPDGIDFRISAPVSVRSDAQRGTLGNRVSSWILRLPIDEPDPLLRAERIREETQRLKQSRQALGVETMMQIAEWTPPVLLSLGAQASSGPINSIVTNVPGPQFPIYMLGAKLLEMYPVVPLLPEMGLAIALFSYDGRLFWGFNADYDLVPDLEQMVKKTAAAFAELAAAVGIEVSTGAAPGAPKRTAPGPGA